MVTQVQTVGGFAYRMKSLDASSARYGKCEVCEEHATEVFMQSAESDGDGHMGTTFGHKECLMSIRGAKRLSRGQMYADRATA